MLADNIHVSSTCPEHIHVIQSISVQRQAMTLETIVMYSLKFSQQYFILDKIFNNIELFTRENNIL